jgi:hypothetical protein
MTIQYDGNRLDQRKVHVQVKTRRGCMSGDVRSGWSSPARGLEVKDRIDQCIQSNRRMSNDETTFEMSISHEKKR